MIGRPALAFAVAIAIAGCPTSSNNSAGSGEAATKASDKPEPAEPSAQKSAGASLLLERRAAGAVTVDLTAISLAKPAAPALGKPMSVRAASVGPGGMERAAASLNGDQFVTARVLAGGAANTYVFERFAVGRDAVVASARVVLPHPLTSIHFVGGSHVIAGAKTELVAVELSESRAGAAAKSAAPRSLKSRPDSRWKAYDLFASAGSYVVAVDDEVMPYYAELIAVGSGAPTVIHSWELPGLVNGQYVHAALRLEDGKVATGELYAVARFSVITGTGQLVTRIPVRAGKLGHGPDIVLNSTAMTDPPVVEEFTPRGGNQRMKTKTVAGTTVSPWLGMAVVPGEGAAEAVLLCAGPRGVLALSEPIAPTSKAKAIAVGGDCLDVVVRGKFVYALARSADAHSLVVMSWEGGTLAEMSRVTVPAAERFVR